MKSDDQVPEPTTVYEIAEYNPVAARFTEMAQRIGQRVYDVTTKDGMAVARQDRAEVRTIRVGLEKIRKELKEPALRRCQQIDSEARTLTRQLEAIEAVPDTAIKAEEQRQAEAKAERERAERVRVEGIHEAIRNIETLPMQAIGKTGDAIAGMVSKLASDFTKSEFAEFAPMARVAYDNTVAKLEQMRVDAIAAAEEQARLAAEREAFEAQQKQEREAAAAAEAARKQQAAEEQARMDAQRAENERAAAEQQAKIDAERAAVEAERQSIEAQRAATEAELQRIEQEKADLAAQQAAIEATKPEVVDLVFAPVGHDIHEDMARIYEIANGTCAECIENEYSDTKILDMIADIARGWIED